MSVMACGVSSQLGPSTPCHEMPNVRLREVFLSMTLLTWRIQGRFSVVLWACALFRVAPNTSREAASRAHLHLRAGAIQLFEKALGIEGVRGSSEAAQN